MVKKCQKYSIVNRKTVKCWNDQWKLKFLENVPKVWKNEMYKKFEYIWNKENLNWQKIYATIRDSKIATKLLSNENRGFNISSKLF